MYSKCFKRMLIANKSLNSKPYQGCKRTRPNHSKHLCPVLYALYSKRIKRTLSTNEFLNSELYQGYEEKKEELEQFRNDLKKKNGITFYQHFDVLEAIFLFVVLVLVLFRGILEGAFQPFVENFIVGKSMQLPIFLGLGTLFAAYIFYVAASAFHMPTKVSRGAYINSSRIILTFIFYIALLVLYLILYFAEASFLLTLFIALIVLISFMRTIQFTLGYGKPINWEHAYCIRSIVPGIIYAESIRKQGRVLEHLLRCFVEQENLNITILDEENRDRFTPLFESDISFVAYFHKVDFTQFMHAVHALNKTEQGAIALEKEIFDNEGIAGYMIYIRKDAQEIDEKHLKKFRKRLFKERIIKLRRKAFKPKGYTGFLGSSEAHGMLVEYACYACTSMDQRRMRVVREIYNLLLDRFSELQEIDFSHSTSETPPKSSSKSTGESNRFLDALKANIAAIIDHAEGLPQKTKDLNSFIDYLRNIKDKLANL